MVRPFPFSAIQSRRKRVVNGSDQIICGYQISYLFAAVRQWSIAGLDELTDSIFYYIYRIANELTGLGRGGQQVQKCKETYIKAVETLVELASLQVYLSSFWRARDGFLNVITDNVLWKQLVTQKLLTSFPLAIIVDCIRYLGWGDQADQPPCQRHRAHYYPPLWEHHQAHHLGAGWAGSWGVLQVCATSLSFLLRLIRLRLVTYRQSVFQETVSCGGLETRSDNWLSNYFASCM